MTDADLWRAWSLWIALTGIVVLIAAALLVTIWLTARRILADAVRALHAVEAIRAHTQPIWGLQETNTVAEDILATVRAIDEKAKALAGALTGPQVRR